MAESRAKRRKLTAEQVAGSQVRYSEVESGIAGYWGCTEGTFSRLLHHNTCR